MYFSGYYNLIYCGVIIETNFFLYNEEKNEEYVFKKILKKYKKLLKKNHILSIKIDIIHIEYFDKKYDMNEIKETLEIQLENLNSNEKKIIKTFDFTDLKNILETL